jgi:hypothetical protein
VLRHPLAIHRGLNAARFSRAIEGFLGFRKSPAGEEEIFDRVFASVLLQEVRTVMAYAHEFGIPGFTMMLTQWPTLGSTASEDYDGVAELYFDSAIYSPVPRTIDEAMSIRNHNRIVPWRTTMRQWTRDLSAGTLTKAQLIEAIREANSYVEGAKFSRELIPGWSIFITGSLSFLNLLFGPYPWASAPGLIVAGLKIYGRLVWASVSSQKPLKHGWYLVSDVSKSHLARRWGKSRKNGDKGKGRKAL